MDVIVILAFLVILGVLANRYGHDSRERPRSPEERLAASGFAWEDRPRPAAPASRATTSPGAAVAPARPRLTLS